VLRTRARLLAVLAAIALMLPGGALARASYFCRMMERVMPSCCCAHAQEREAQRAPRASAPDCCERMEAPSRSNASPANAAVPLVAPAALLAVLPAYLDVLALLGVESAVTPQARAPPSLGPPLFVVHCSLLI
jgi:hypothetical protein